MPTDYEERRIVKPWKAWGMLIALCGLIVAWGLLNYAIIPDRTAEGQAHRQWDYGVLPDAPGQSVYSSEQTPTTLTPPRQFSPLPETEPASQEANPK
jgi:hypothetical protein